jgi:hypothetical protein
VADIPPIQECFLVEATEHSVTISWKLTSPDTKSFLIERREIKPEGDGRVKAVWKQWEGADVQISGDSVTAHFRKLPPGTFWNIRITGIDSNGLAGQPPKGHFRIETKPMSPLFPTWVWASLVLVATVGVVWFFKNKITFVKDDLDARIAHLEK